MTFEITFKEIVPGLEYPWKYFQYGNKNILSLIKDG